MVNGQLNNDEYEKYRQEGREEVLDWLISHDIVKYSSWDKFYFIYNRFTDILLQLPWRRDKK